MNSEGDATVDIVTWFRTELAAVCAVEPFDEADWWPLVRLEQPSDRLHAPFGFLVPREAPDVAMANIGAPTFRLVLRLCPQVISRQTAGLHDEQLANYFKAWKLHLCIHVENRGRLPDAEIERLADDALWDSAPEFMRVFSETQMTALG
jgi:hypothetical protein